MTERRQSGHLPVAEATEKPLTDDKETNTETYLEQETSHQLSQCAAYTSGDDSATLRHSVSTSIVPADAACTVDDVELTRCESTGLIPMCNFDVFHLCPALPCLFRWQRPCKGDKSADRNKWSRSRAMFTPLPVYDLMIKVPD